MITTKTSRPSQIGRLRHGFKDHQCIWPLTSMLTCIDGSVIAHHIPSFQQKHERGEIGTVVLVSHHKIRMDYRSILNSTNRLSCCLSGIGAFEFEIPI